MMSLTTTTTLVLPPLSCSAARRPHTTTVKTDREQRQNNAGFSGKKKKLSWHCVEGCGACCKLQKGPSYPSPQEIFTDPSDVEVHFPLFSVCYNNDNDD